MADDREEAPRFAGGDLARVRNCHRTEVHFLLCSGRSLAARSSNDRLWLGDANKV